MATGRNKSDWRHTAALMALVASAAGGRTVDPSRFNPYHVEAPPMPMTARELGQLLIRKGTP